MDRQSGDFGHQLHGRAVGQQHVHTQLLWRRRHDRSIGYRDSGTGIDTADTADTHTDTAGRDDHRESNEPDDWRVQRTHVVDDHGDELHGQRRVDWRAGNFRIDLDRRTHN